MSDSDGLNKVNKKMIRHIFRLTYFKNIERFLQDGAVFAKNHHRMQPCWRTSYENIVARRGRDFFTPHDENINDFVPFYFSLKTPMAYSIFKGNVPLISPQAENEGVARLDDIVFLVTTAQKIANSGLTFWFSDVACNSMAPETQYCNDISSIENHIQWSLFDEHPKGALINEVNYNGVCNWFHDRDDGVHNNRAMKRGAEFMVKDRLPMKLVDCIVVKNDDIKRQIETWMQASDFRIPVLTKTGCYF